MASHSLDGFATAVTDVFRFQMFYFAYVAALDFAFLPLSNPVPVNTKSSKQRAQVSSFLRDIGRFYRGDITALDRWHGKRIAGVKLVTSSHTLKSIEAQLSDFAIYTTFNGGVD